MGEEPMALPGQPFGVATVADHAWVACRTADPRIDVIVSIAPP